ncbi:purine nucleoside phosphorylase [Gordonia araii NBRC 100433]|uniref:Purine nucleoside phosphorylase n=1 Tax=Gordonia araii NBRC 100433 TaxID=1073574 RepID=G7GYM4_9ACTN|nr:purine-nucleoside phosphorylase [Gordonia araii]NNG99234.1 purine-nucleoside phosphorylase [Gordonia araii NBRC 100433]GAB08699.1 purine nucleoside phosphorylase [Gordonia araii NBRC 100433]
MTARPDATAAAAYIATESGVPRHDIAIVLGSGWSEAVQAFGSPVAELPMSGVPGFAAPRASGHSGTITSARVDDQRVLVLAGRTHAYEGHDLASVVHPVRTAAAAGCSTIILTNAAGAVNHSYRVGSPVLIRDHINLTARSPLVGAEFVNMVDAYSPALRATAQRVHDALDGGHGVTDTLDEGVYAGLPGPQYETPAEITMLRTLGADLVGMSTVHETIAARAAGLEVLGISLVTNLAAGITGEPLNHTEVLESGQAAAGRIGALLLGIVHALSSSVGPNPDRIADTSLGPNPDRAL